MIKITAAILATLWLLVGAAIVTTTDSTSLQTAGGGGGTINTLDQFTSDGTNITQRTANKPFKLTGPTPGGCLQLTSGNVATTTGTPCPSSSSVVGTISTSSPDTAGQVLFFSTTNGYPAKVGSIATGTVSGGSVISATANRSVLGGALTITTTGGTFGTGDYVFPANASTTGTMESGGAGGVETYAMGSGVGTIGFNSLGYAAGVTGYGALMQLAPSTGVFTMFAESNVTAGSQHGHTTTISWDSLGVVSIPQGLLVTGSTTFSTNATTTGNFFAGVASSTKTFGGGLQTCSGASDAVTWTGGLFGCHAISAAVAWGAITGTLSNQTDLQAQLNQKIGTSTAGVAGQLLFYSTTGASPELVSSVATTTLAGTANQITISNSPVVIGGTPSVVSLPSPVTFPGSASFGVGSILTAPYASTTYMSSATASTSVFTLSGVTNALHLGSSVGLVSAYAGATCSANNFATALSAVGGLTCGQVSLTAGVSGITPIANGGTNASAFTTTNNAIYWDATRLVTAGVAQAVTTPYASSTMSSMATASTTALFVSNLINGRIPYVTTDGQLTSASTFLFDGSKMTVTGATTTNLSVSGELVVPANKTLTVAQEITSDDTDFELRYYAGGRQNVVKGYFAFSVSFASSTQGIGTTTIRVGTAPAALTVNSVQCDFSNFMTVSLTDATPNRADPVLASSTIGLFNYSTNNVFTAGEAIRVEIGTTTNIAGAVSGGCTLKGQYTAQ